MISQLFESDRFNLIDFIAKRQEYIDEIKKDITIYVGLPAHWKNDPLIIDALHEIAIDKFEYTSMGYDVLKKQFFVNELFHFTDKEGTEFKYHFPNYFADFASFFKHVGGRIYEKSCYFGYSFSKAEIKKYNLDLSKINFISLENDTMDDLDLSFLPMDPSSVNVDLWHNMVKDIIAALGKANPSNAYEALRNHDGFTDFSCDSWGKDIITPAFIQWVKQNPQETISKIGKIMSESSFPYLFRNGVCAISLLYPDEMLESMPTHIQSGSKRERNEIRDLLVDALQKGIDIIEEKGYDNTLKVFYIKRSVYSLGRSFCTYSLTFSAFADFASELSNDLSDCNLLHAPLDGIDLSLYKTNSKTIFDVKYLDYEPEECFRNGYSGNRFYIQHCLVDHNDNVIACRSYRYIFFFDFLHVLKNNLAGCFLADCEGLENVPNLLQYHVDQARIPSAVLEKVGMSSTKLDKYKFEVQRSSAFKPAEENEKLSRSVLSRYAKEPERSECRVYYISDLHLHNKLKANKNIKTEIDIMQKIKEWVNLLSESQQTRGPMIIAGDICHEKALCRYFLKLLSFKRKDIIIVPGNHELWHMNVGSLDTDLLDYQNFVESLGMTFLQNCILYKYDREPNWKRISEDDILNLSIQEIRDKVKYARFVVFGGLGFSGYNPEYNANIGLYRKTLPSVKDDLFQTQRFERLYQKIEQCFLDREMIIATHTPITDWNNNPVYHRNWIYINGHTHHNYFQDDGDMRIYADNQSGYKGQHFSLKSVLIQGEYDVFSDYADGIYPISPEQYLDFAKGKNMNMSFNRKGINIIMLKKNGYYCFVGQSQTKNTLYILDGGKISRLNLSSIQDCFDCMDAEIELIEKPLAQYTAVQEQIAAFIKRIGGYGKIHGCIIDIDFPGVHGLWSMNHIYLNPEDGKITCYWASSIVDKQLYKNFASLLKYSCPELFVSYQAQLQYAEKTSFPPALLLPNQKLSAKTTPYESTDMYRASKRIKTMQYLNKNVLRTWVNIPYSSPKTLPNSGR